MRILLQNTAFRDDPTIQGGSEQQITDLIKQYNSMGHEASFSSSDTIDLASFDIVHLTHINLHWTAGHFQNCFKQNKPIVVKCIWHRYGDNFSQVVNVARYATALTYESPTERNEMFAFLHERIDDDEIERIYRKTKIMLPGITPVFSDAGKPLTERKLVHINGRFERRKRQHMVIEACKDLNLPVIAIGWVADQKYFLECEGLNYGQLRGPLSKEELHQVYNDTRVYVCASVRELNSGSVNEAIACGCNVLSSAGHFANDVFTKSGYAVFQDEQDLRAKLQAMYNSPSPQANEWWSIERLANEYLKLYQKRKAMLI